MAQTRQITVNDVTPTIIIPSAPCKSLRVTENRGVAGWPTSDFLIFKGSAGATPVRIQAGAQYSFSAGATFLGTLTPCGWIQTVSGTTTFDVDEGQG